MHVILEVIVLIGKLLGFYCEALFRKFVPPGKKSIRGKVVVITGGAGGLGRCLALKFAGLGAHVAVWDINKTLNEETAKNISSLGGRATAVVCDVTDPQSVRSAASRTRNELGEVDMLINNAGIMPCRRLLDLSEEEINRTINVNTVSHFWTVREFLPHMLEQKEGHIVTVASMASKGGAALMTDYCASKFGAYGFTEALNAELHMMGAKNIRSTTVCPMHIDTNLLTAVASRVDYRNRLGGVASVDDVSEAIIDGVLRNNQYVYFPSYIDFMTNSLKSLVPTKAIPCLTEFVDTGFFEKKVKKQ